MKPVFPTIYSTLSPAALATLVSEKYGIKHAQCKLLVRGVGDTYLVESPARRFILRILAAIPYLSLGFWLFMGHFIPRTTSFTPLSSPLI